MEITDVKTKLVSIPLKKEYVKWTSSKVAHHYRDFSILEILTDEGEKGVSFTSSHKGEGSTLNLTAYIIQNLREVLVGEDPFATARIMEKMYRMLGRRAGNVRAIGMVDNALWDIKGKTLKMPLYKLLGGNRDKVRCYVTGGYYEKDKGLEDLSKEMAGYVEQGLTAIKMKIGALSVSKDAERVKAARDAIGPDTDLMADANCAYDAYTAIEMGRELEKLGVYFFEEPLPYYDLRGYIRVAAALDIAIAGVESENNFYVWRNLMESGAVDIVQPDATVLAGISEWLRVATLAKAWNLPLAPHTATEVHAQLAGAVPEVIFVESIYERLEDEVFAERLEPKNGYFELPKMPGLGIEFDEKVVEKYLVK